MDGVPFVLVTAIGIVSAIALAKNEDVPKDHLRVKVLAQQFTWSFEYPQYNNMATTTLRLPVDRTVELEMTARDVIHSFYVPEFRQKEDILPGEVRNLVITPTKTGRYVIQCAELCGLGHAAMLGRRDRDDEGGLHRRGPVSGRGAAGGAGADPGKTVFANNGCGSCHTYRRPGARGRSAPTWISCPSTPSRRSKPLEDFDEGFDRQPIWLHPARIPERHAAVQQSSGGADRTLWSPS